MKNLTQTRQAWQWLVSVQSIDEANMVMRYGIDLLDWKSPAEGPLAPVAVSVWDLVENGRKLIASDRGAFDPPTLSAALGESDQAVVVAPQLPGCFAHAKVGPSGCRTNQQLESVWRAVRTRLPSSVELVAVAYADHQRADCLPIEAVLELAIDQGFKRILIDTFDKKNGSSLKQLSMDSLHCFAEVARRRSMWWALAGSIRLSDVMDLEDRFADPTLRPDCLAVRGDICQGDRSGSISRQRLREWQAELKRGR